MDELYNDRLRMMKGQGKKQPENGNNDGICYMEGHEDINEKLREIHSITYQRTEKEKARKER